MPLAKEIMTKNLITIRKDCPVFEAIDIMLKNKISGLPVVDDDMGLIGVITEKDLLELAFKKTIEDEKVAEHMSTDVITMDEELDVLDVCECLMTETFKRVPIVSKDKLVGIISRRDILRYILDM